MTLMKNPILLILALCAIAPLTASAADRRDAPEDPSRLDPAALLREATDRAARVDGPWSLLQGIAWAAPSLEKGEALRVLKGVEKVYEQKVPHAARHSQWAALAVVVAPLDTAARDRYLRRAVVEADAALTNEKLWRPRTVPPGSIPYWPPEEQAAEERQLLVFDRDLWAALLEADENKRAQRLIDLLHQTQKAGLFGGDDLTSYQHWHLRRWAQLDPSTFLAVAPREVPASELAPLATYVASDLTNRYGYNDSAKRLIEWAAGKHEMRPHERELLREYELRGYWDEAWALEPGEARTARLETVIYNRAIYAGPSRAGDVAYRWASEVADPTLRERLQRAAETGGNVSNTARGVEPAITQEERKRQWQERRANYDPQVIRILDHPHDVSWLTDKPYSRVQMLAQAAALAWQENQEWGPVQSILDAIPTVEERDAVLFELAKQGQPPAAEAFRHIASDRLWSAAASSAAEAVASGRRSGER